MPQQDATFATSEMITVRRFFHPVRAQIAAGLVRAHGIPVLLHGINHASLDWLISNALGGIRLQVPVVAAQQVSELLDVDFDTTEFADSGCPACNSLDTTSELTSWKFSLLIFHMLSIPMPWNRSRNRCNQCNHSWDVLD